MRKKTKKWLATAALLVLTGGVILVSVMAAQKWDFTKLSTSEYETSRYEITESFQSVSVNTNTAGIKLVPSDHSNAEVVCYEQKNVKYSVAVKDGTLFIRAVDTRKWYEHIGIDFHSPEITIYLPEREYRALFLEEGIGGVEISRDITFTELPEAVAEIMEVIP